MARKVRDNIVVLQVYNIDLGDANGDVALDMMCPGDGAIVLDWSIQISTAGTGAAANHNCVLEHGTTSAGVALTPLLAVDADAVAGVVVTGEALDSATQRAVATVQGTKIQIQNTESAAISNGAIVDVLVRWRL